VEPRLLDDQGRPNFGISFYAVNKAGEHAGVSMYPGPRYAVCSENGPEILDCQPLLER
jgi:N4-(beta-N-acetylglucosaminyl)-L-asparaginase